MAIAQLLFRRSALLALLLVAACTSQAPQEPAPAPVEKPPQPAVLVPPTPRPPPPAPRPAPAAAAAWQPLLARAEQATERGDYEEALALLERVQRIEPDSGEVYLCMARTHRARGDAAQAKATAERGLLYCSTEAMCSALRGFAH